MTTLAQSPIARKSSIAREAESVAHALASPDLLGFDFPVTKHFCFSSPSMPQTVYDADMQPSTALINPLLAKGFSTIVAKGRVYSCPSDRYVPLQPGEWFRQVLEAVDPFDVKGIKTRMIGGSLFVDVKFDTVEIARADRQVGDLVSFGVRFADSINSTRNFSTSLWGERLWCLNGCTHEAQQAGFNRRHTKNIQIGVDAMMSGLRKAIDEIPQIARSYGDLARREISPDERNHLLDVILKIDDESTTRALNVRNEVEGLTVSGIGNTGRTLFDVFNGVTEYETHHRTTRGAGSIEAIESARFLNANGLRGMNQGKTLSGRAFAKLTEALTVEPFSIEV